MPWALIAIYSGTKFTNWVRKMVALVPVGQWQGQEGAWR